MNDNQAASLQAFENLAMPQNKAELIERMDIAYQAAESLISAYSEADLTRPLSQSGWSAKDYLAHMRDWENGLVVLLQKKVRYLEMGLTKELVASGDYDAENDILYRNHKNRPLSDILADFRHTHQELLDTLAGLTYEDLQKPYIYYQPDAEEVAPGDYVNSPVMGWLTGDTYKHYAEHILDIGRLLQ